MTAPHIDPTTKKIIGLNPDGYTAEQLGDLEIPCMSCGELVEFDTSQSIKTFETAHAPDRYLVGLWRCPNCGDAEVAWLRQQPRR